MTYSKPEIRSLASAVKAVQGSGKPLFLNQDNSVSPVQYNAQTIGAYESDE
jgi:hypothetical protein